MAREENQFAARQVENGGDDTRDEKMNGESQRGRGQTTIER